MEMFIPSTRALLNEKNHGKKDFINDRRKVETLSVLQIRRNKRDNLEIIFHITPLLSE